MKSLYDKNFKYTNKAIIIDQSTNDKLKSLFLSFCAEGFSPREISHIMQSSIIELELDILLRMDSKNES